MLLVESVVQANQSNSHYALKVIYKHGLHPQEVKIIRSEASILQKFIGKSNIVQIENVKQIFIVLLFSFSKLNHTS